MTDPANAAAGAPNPTPNAPAAGEDPAVLRAQLAEAKQRAQELEGYLLDPAFTEYLRSKVEANQAAADEGQPATRQTAGGGDEGVAWDKLSPGEYAEALLSQVETMIRKEIAPVRTDAAIQSAQAQVKEAEAKHTDFWNYEHEMVRIAQKHPSLTVEECYQLAKGQGGKRPAQAAKPANVEVPGGAGGRRVEAPVKGARSHFDRAWGKAVGDADTV